MKTGFCRAVGQQIHDVFDQPIVFKGVGIGGWLLIEGYMIKSHGSIDRPRRFEAHVRKHVGQAYADTFMRTWRQRFFTSEDVKLLARMGYNTIRIALDYAVFFEPSSSEVVLAQNEDAFVMLDCIIASCKAEGVYVILDLHAAPGGQTGTNIDNSAVDHPDLFRQPHYQDQTVYVWETLAKRYRHEPCIAAYDLLNEPLPNWFSQYNPSLIPFYERLIAAIRAIDQTHMITLEGLHWSTDWSCFKTRMDDNVLLQFHKYWNAPDQESIQPYIEMGQQLNCPIMMGEGGENNLLWYAAAFKMYDQLNISYCFWTYKKMAAHNALISFSEPKDWQAFLAGTLDQHASQTVLDTLLEAIAFKNSAVHEAVSHAILNKNTFTCPAYGYDYYGPAVSFKAHTRVQTSIRKKDGLRITDVQGVVIAADFGQHQGEDTPLKDRLVLHLKVSEWVTYTFTVDTGFEQGIVTVKGDALEGLFVTLDGHVQTLIRGRMIFKTTVGPHQLRLEARQPVRLEALVFSR